MNFFSRVSLNENFLKLQNSEKGLTDVSFKCNGGRIRVHSHILAAQSSVFREYLASVANNGRNYCSSEDFGHLPFDLPQVTLNDLAAFLLLMYTGHTSIPWIAEEQIPVSTSGSTPLINVLETLAKEVLQMVTVNFPLVRGPEKETDFGGSLKQYERYYLRCVRTLESGTNEEGIISFSGQFTPISLVTDEVEIDTSSSSASELSSRTIPDQDRDNREPGANPQVNPVQPQPRSPIVGSLGRPNGPNRGRGRGRARGSTFKR